MDKDQSKIKLIGTIKEQVEELMEKTLDYAEVAVPNNDQYKKLRSKILRIGNNAIRNLTKEITTRYEVMFKPIIIENKGE